MTKTLLAVFAHPDDEVFGSGGTLARYAAEGVNVQLICATRGESGKITDPSLGSVNDVGSLREQELKDACQALGIQTPIFLGYHDSGRQDRTQHDNGQALMHAGERELELKLLTHIQKIQPQIMLTFDPHGIYGHVDHLIMHRVVTATFWSAGNLPQPAPQRLFYSVMTEKRLRQMQARRNNSPLAKLDPKVYGVSEASLAANFDIKYLMPQKRSAIRAHRSQTGPNSSFGDISEKEWLELFGHETFTLGGLRGAFPEPPVDDFFAGLKQSE